MSDRKCPDCGERLSFDAIRCACGWGKREGKGAKYFDMVCTYKAGTDRCAYPVGMFAEGNTSGWCIFHRQHLSQLDGAEVVRQSRMVPYLDALKPIIERGANSPSVVATAWDIAKRHGNKPWMAGNEKTFSDAIRNGERDAA